MPRAAKNTSSRRAQTPSVTKPKERPFPCPVRCREPFSRKQERDRHTLSFHLPDCYCCPVPSCPWRGHRKEALDEHINKGTCSPRPINKLEDQCMVYDKKLILEWIFDSEEPIPVEVVANYALDFVQQRATELGKEDAWRDPWPVTKERQKFIT